MSEFRITDATFDCAPDFKLEQYAKRSFGTVQEEAVEAVLRIVPGASRDAASFIFHPN